MLSESESKCSVYVSNVDERDGAAGVKRLLSHIAPVVSVERLSSNGTRCIYRAEFNSVAAARTALSLSLCPLGSSFVVVSSDDPRTSSVPTLGRPSPEQEVAAEVLKERARNFISRYATGSLLQSSEEKAACVFVCAKGKEMTNEMLTEVFEPCGTIVRCVSVAAVSETPTTSFFLQFKSTSSIASAMIYNGAYVDKCSLWFVAQIIMMCHCHMFAYV